VQPNAVIKRHVGSSDTLQSAVIFGEIAQTFAFSGILSLYRDGAIQAE
jgi:hypothetical protein